MPTFTDEGIVLRTHKLGEADRIITLLTKAHGKFRAVAKGIRRTSSKFGARLEPFSQVKLQIASGRTLGTITQAVLIRNNIDPLGSDYQRFTTGQVMVETADRLVAVEGEPALQQYYLLSGALKALLHGTSNGVRSPVTIMDSYLLRAVSFAGYAPVFDECAKCGKPGPHAAFSVPAGGMVCTSCRPPSSPHIRPDTLGYLKALSIGDWPSIRNISSQVTNDASAVVASFTTWQLERGLRSIAHVER